jgi:hypothetical protein
VTVTEADGRSLGERGAFWFHALLVFVLPDLSAGYALADVFCEARPGDLTLGFILDSIDAAEKPSAGSIVLRCGLHDGVQTDRGRILALVSDLDLDAIGQAREGDD